MNLTIQKKDFFSLDPKPISAKFNPKIDWIN